LREIHSAPKLLYLRGDISYLNEMPCVAVVGTRKCTSYGKQATISLVRDLARAGVCIVSGLALGIDAWAHGTALEENAKTVAVLGSGIDDKSIAVDQCTSKCSLSQTATTDTQKTNSEYCRATFHMDTNGDGEVDSDANGVISYHCYNPAVGVDCPGIRQYCAI